MSPTDPIPPTSPWSISSCEVISENTVGDSFYSCPSTVPLTKPLIGLTPRTTSYSSRGNSLYLEDNAQLPSPTATVLSLPNLPPPMSPTILSEPNHPDACHGQGPNPCSMLEADNSTTPKPSKISRAHSNTWVRWYQTRRPLNRRHSAPSPHIWPRTDGSDERHLRTSTQYLGCQHRYPKSPLSHRSPIHKYKLPTLHQTPSLHIVSTSDCKRISDLLSSLDYMRTNLKPLVSITTGCSHPEFPISLLQFHLLTHATLDSLAKWYHQTLEDNIPGADGTILSERYPAPILASRVWIRNSWESNLFPPGTSIDGVGDGQIQIDLNAKRRRFGRFIGLRGCESPIDAEDTSTQILMEGELSERMDREWEEMLERAVDDGSAESKSWKWRF